MAIGDKYLINKYDIQIPHKGKAMVLNITYKDIDNVLQFKVGPKVSDTEFRYEHSWGFDMSRLASDDPQDILNWANSVGMDGNLNRAFENWYGGFGQDNLELWEKVARFLKIDMENIGYDPDTGFSLDETLDEIKVEKGKE